ncbi:MAG: PHP domain-containing protein, partial [Bacteroidales bacterium]|nr:PHP domain-containing protein [Bacteroidales bacterium]
MYLNCHSYYSLRYGTMSVEQLVQKAVTAGAGSVVLTDINNSTAIPEFAGECIRNNIKPVAGIEFRNDNELLYIGIARNNKGLRELNELLSRYNFEKTPLPFPAPALSEAYIIYPQQKTPQRQLFDNERIGIKIEDANKLLTLPSDERNRMVILNPVTFADSDDIFIHKSLRAVDNNILLSHLKPWQCAGNNEFFHPPDVVRQAFSVYPEIIKNTNKLLEECSLSFDFENQK